MLHHTSQPSLWPARHGACCWRCCRMGLLVACCMSALLVSTAFTNVRSALGRRPATVLQAQAGPKKATAQEPWKPLVFKMPQKKPPRKLEPGDDGFTLKMRDRLKAISAKEGDEPDNLITVSTENAKNLALSAMWYIDQETDRKKFEKESPDAEVLKRRYDGALGKLELPREAPPPKKKETPSAGGNLEIGRSIDELLANAPARAAPRAAHSADQAREAAAEEAEDEGEDEGVADYLATLQKRSLQKRKDNKKWLKKTIVRRSPEDRKKDYEATKVRMFGITAALSGVGFVYTYAAYGVSIAFSFGLGAIGGLLYLSGLASYTDNAENPMGSALGARRLLTPVIVLLVVQGWPRIEVQVPEIAELHLQPALLPAILGFFVYTVGKVLAGLFQ